MIQLLRVESSAPDAASGVVATGGAHVRTYCTITTYDGAPDPSSNNADVPAALHEGCTLVGGLGGMPSKYYYYWQEALMCEAGTGCAK